MAFDSKSTTLDGTGRSRRRLTARIVSRMMDKIGYGHISVVLPSGDRIDHSGEQAGPSATLVIHRWRTFRRLISQGDLGFAQSYIDGDWSSPDLATLLELAAMNTAVIYSRMPGFWPSRVLNRIRHLLHVNSRAGSRRNIAFHYDLGNAFYGQWLDPEMTYSSALYAHPNQTLEDAQDAKLKRVLELLDLKGDENALEIGCGWGALAVRLAHASARVTGITLSSEQLAFAQEKVASEDLTDRITLELRDYRDVEGTYDRIVSIEMLEAVGETYWPIYFKMLNERLSACGKAVLQVITIDEARFEAYRTSADFIQRHIFPGGMLPTKTIIAEQSARAGLDLVLMQSFGESYAATLAEWRRRFWHHGPASHRWASLNAFGGSGTTTSATARRDFEPQPSMSAFTFLPKADRSRLQGGMRTTGSRQQCA